MVTTITIATPTRTSWAIDRGSAPPAASTAERILMKAKMRNASSTGVSRRRPAR